jgi:DNA-binding NarL/FixJ family response regulator
MRILIVEDDDMQSDWLIERLKREFRTEPDLIRTESEFYDRLDALSASPPNIIIIDIMLPWTEVERDSCDAPPEIRGKGWFDAGLRCEKLLHEREETKSIPVILYSMLEPKNLPRDLPRNVVFVSKVYNIDDLIEQIHSLASEDA